MTTVDPRPATPADDLAPLLRAPAPVLWARYCGSDRAALRVLRSIVPRPGHTASYDCCTVVLEQGRPVGVLAGYPSSEEEARGRRFARLSLPRVAPWNWPGAFAILRSAERLRPPVPQNAWYVDALAVAPEARRRGVARALLDQAVERARAAGCAVVALDTDLDNAGAQALYEGAGFARGVEIPFAGDRYVPGPGTVAFARTV
jgi:ribosomal protein S18 acetylase RimI-like enzyme